MVFRSESSERSLRMKKLVKFLIVAGVAVLLVSALRGRGEEKGEAVSC